jgi:hypothetical protein
MLTSVLVIEGLIGLVEEQPELFSAEDRADLEQQSATLPDNIDDMARSLVVWSKARPAIHTALKSLSSQTREGKARLPGDGTTAPKIKPEDYKQMLLNMMHRSFSTPPQSFPAKS